MSGRLAALFAVGRPKADDVFSLVTELERRGVRLEVRRGRLVVHSPRPLPADLRRRLAAARAELAERLRAGVVHLTPSRRAILRAARLPPEPLPF